MPSDLFCKVDGALLSRRFEDGKAVKYCRRCERRLLKDDAEAARLRSELARTVRGEGVVSNDERQAEMLKAGVERARRRKPLSAADEMVLLQAYIGHRPVGEAAGRLTVDPLTVYNKWCLFRTVIQTGASPGEDVMKKYRTRLYADTITFLLQHKDEISLEKLEKPRRKAEPLAKGEKRRKGQLHHDTEWLHKEIVRLAKVKKKPDGFIAKKLGVTSGAVSYHRRKENIPPNGRNIPTSAEVDEMVSRIGKETASAIGDDLGFGHNTVLRYVRRWEEEHGEQPRRAYLKHDSLDTLKGARRDPAPKAGRRRVPAAA